MKKICTSILSVFIVLIAQAQAPVLTLSSDNICAGETVTATVRGPELSLDVPANINSLLNGVMFDLVGDAGAIIKGFTASVEIDNSSFEVYYRTGSYIGFDASSTGWTLLGSSTSIPQGISENIGVELDLEILPGQTLGFYVTCSGVGQTFGQEAAGLSGTISSNSFLSFNSGIILQYPFEGATINGYFKGGVLFEPTLSDITWAGNTSTVDSAEFTFNQIGAVLVSASYGLEQLSASAIVTVNEYQVEAVATPEILGWGQSSTITANVSQSTGLGTRFDYDNSAHGAMFNISATNAISINGFSVLCLGTDPADLEIFYKTGTLVGSELNAGAWTSLGTTTGVVSEEVIYVPLNTPLNVAAGQTMAIHITRTDEGNLRYTNGVGAGTEVSSDVNLSVTGGVGVFYPFTTIYSNRELNTIIHYEVENPAGLNYSWAPGGQSSGTITVMPNADATYTVTVGNGDCEATDDVAVSMALGIDNAVVERIKVYPNPATDNITIRADQAIDVEHIILMDVSGKIIYRNVPIGAFTVATIPVNQLAKGMYVLQINVNGKLTNRKVAVK